MLAYKGYIIPPIPEKSLQGKIDLKVV